MRTTHSRFRWWLLAVAALAGSAVELQLQGDAHAIMGRPLTPFSYAGVARRTTRRAAVYGAATGGYGAGYYGYPPPPPPPAPYPPPPPPPAPYPYYW